MCLVLRTSVGFENPTYSCLFVYYFFESVLLAFRLIIAACPTTEAALQTRLLPTQERRKGCFAKALGRLKKVLVGRILVSDIRRSPDACSANKCRIRESDLRSCDQENEQAKAVP